MSDLQVDEVIKVTPDAPEKDSYCHILDGSGVRFYCGKPHPSGRYDCKLYEGESLCPSCGQVTCPTCAVMSSLDDRLEDPDADVQ